jgi:hypothetical protein
MANEGMFSVEMLQQMQSRIDEYRSEHPDAQADGTP